MSEKMQLLLPEFLDCSMPFLQLYVSISAQTHTCFFTLSLSKCFQLEQIDDWRDIALPRVLSKTPRARLLGANSAVTGFGSEYETVNSGDTVPHPT